MPKTWMQSFTGQYIEPRDIDPKNVRIEDVAHALSLKCRYQGHCSEFYSVADHCILGLRFVPDDLKLPFLLHELDEVFLPDVPRPIKDDIFFRLPIGSMIPWHEIAQRQEAAILQGLGLFDYQALLHAPAVKKADNLMLAWEARDLMGDPPKDWGLTEPCPKGLLTLRPLTSRGAEVGFLDLYRSLREKE